MKKILVVNGPNLNMLGTREKTIYGDISYDGLVDLINSTATRLDLETDVYQSNHEGDIVDKIHAAKDNVSAIVINPAAFTHTSVAIRDALLAVSLPVYEVHISNVHAREEFRRHSYVSDIAVAVICGLGVKGYICALESIADS